MTPFSCPPDDLSADPCVPLEQDTAPPATAAPLPAGSWLALLGGGQLGTMFCRAAQQLGYRVAALDPDPAAPIQAVADKCWTAAYDDPQALQALSTLAQTVTVEFENVPYATLAHLAMHMPVRPAADSVAIAQDRLQEKMFFARHGLPVGAFMILRHADDLAQAQTQHHLFPGRLKTTRLGYDGKGQRTVAHPEQLENAFHQLGNVPCVLEKQLNLTREVSVLIARDAQGEIALWPVAENIHRDGILDTTLSPARITDALAREACSHAQCIVENLGYRGVLCIEFFISDDTRLFLNEMAPRPHNSGHHTIESCVTSQFEQQARIAAGLPLGDTTQHRPAVMINLMGDLWFIDGDTPHEPDWNALLHDKHQVYLHLYGKKEARRGRKMGHITCCADTLDAALHTAQTLRRALHLPDIVA